MISNDTSVYAVKTAFLYVPKLNATSILPGTVTNEPERLVKMRYEAPAIPARTDRSRWYGMEARCRVQNYAYTTDNGGRQQCIDLTQ